MAVLGGNENPSTSDIQKILESVGCEYDETMADKLVSELDGKKVHEVIAAGREKLVNFGGGGGGGCVAPASGGGAIEAQSGKKEEKKVEEEEEEEDMEFDLFG